MNRLFIFGIFILLSTGFAICQDKKATEIGIAMISVPAGSFQRDAKPDNISVVSSFKISTTEITRSMYKSVMGIDPSDPRVTNGGENEPVQSVNWYQVIAFCNKLSIIEGKKLSYSVEGIADWSKLAFSSIPKAKSKAWDQVKCDWTANGYRLPTEMEWLWAAMGAPFDGQNDRTNTNGYQKLFAGYNWMNSINEYANVPGNNEIGVQGTRPVAMKKPNELGIYDMTGNVWEWCWDWFANSGGPHQNDAKGQEYKVKGTAIDYRGGTVDDYGLKVIRGGAYYGNLYRCYLSFRMISPTTNATDSYGFRVACTY